MIAVTNSGITVTRNEKRDASWNGWRKSDALRKASCLHVLWGYLETAERDGQTITATQLLDLIEQECGGAQ